MTPVYHPPQRAVGALILSLGQWLRGTFHLPKLHAFEDHLARGRTFFSLTKVSLSPGAPLEFLALRASAAHLVVPDAVDRHVLFHGNPGTVRHEVSCYLEHVAVHGALELRPGVRTSDFLAHKEGFITLRGCRLVPLLAGRVEPVPVVFVNARAIVAVAEEGGRLAEQPAEAAAPTPVPVA